MIDVVGGGPAGLAAGIALARSGREVVVHESGVYPRHRVCGEFLSHDAAGALAELGLGDLCDRLRAPSISAARATVSRRGRVVADVLQALPTPARGLARHDLDASLAAAARGAGAVVRERARVENVSALRGEHVLLATGRSRRPVAGEREGPRGWVGVKMHVRGFSLGGVTELHFVRGAYAGLIDVVCCGERVVNICALLRREAFEGDPFEALAAASPAFAARWRTASPLEETRCATAGFDFAIRGATAGGALCAGDAAALVAPFVGDGQAIALHTGLLAAAALADPETRIHAMQRGFSAVRPRLLLARSLQRVLLMPSLAAPLVRFMGRSEAALARVYRATHGDVSACAAAAR